MNRYECTHIKHGVVYDSYRTTRTICEGTDEEGTALVEVCDLCKTFIITIKTTAGRETILEVDQEWIIKNE